MTNHETALYKKALETILRRVKEDNSSTNRAEFRAWMEGYVTGILGTVETEKKQ